MGASNRRDETGADRGVGLWLSRDDEGSIVRYPSAVNADGPDNAERPDNELSVHRALARAAATAYARQLKAAGLAPEQMLVLVKAATSIHGLLGFGAQALTSDIVRWSIDAYFDDNPASPLNPPRMSAEPKSDFSEFADFADALRKQRRRGEMVVRRALNRAKAHYPVPFDELNDVSRALDNALSVVERAIEELRVQNDALFAARTEVEDAYAQFRDFFEFAPAAYVVTTPDTRVRYANHAACSLLGLRRNGLAGQLLISCVPLESRGPFRSALIRSLSPGMISDWPATLLAKDGTSSRPFSCRIRIRAVPASGASSPTALYWNFTEETDEDLF